MYTLALASLPLVTNLVFPGLSYSLLVGLADAILSLLARPEPAVRYSDPRWNVSILAQPMQRSRLYPSRSNLAVCASSGKHDAVLGRGTIPYFSERNSFDLLGKNDAIIADQSIRPNVSRPGHNKFDYDLSLARF